MTTEPDAKASFAKFSLGPGGALAEHRHETTEELAYLLSGRGVVGALQGLDRYLNVGSAELRLAAMSKVLPSRTLPSVLCGLLVLGACKQKGEAAAEASANVIQSEDEICNLLTAEEVSAEMKQPVTGRLMPSTGKYSAPSCGWLTAEAPDSPGFELTLFFHPDSPNGPSNFTKKVKDVCSAPTYDGNKPVQVPEQAIEGLGDEAFLCRKLLVRKGNNFFYLEGKKGDPAVPWQDAARRLAAKVVSRLP